VGRQPKGEDTGRVDEAFNRVLAAEAEAREQVEACRQAAEVLKDAEAHARRISNRTDRRLRLTHQIADQAVGRALGELAEVPAEPAVALPDDATLERLGRIIDRLAGEILADGAGKTP
jgi:regulator of protease activity HflC (stomatin/prohibitin superfamily)